MPPRASWKGQLKISLVSVPVRLYNVVSTAYKVSLNQLHKGCNHRIRYQNVCAEHGQVDRSDIVKGYEYEKGKYVVIDEADLESVSLESTKSIEVVQFVGADETDSIYLNAPYYVAPDGPVADEAFSVVREALRKSNKVGVGRVVMHNKEQIIAIKPQDKRFLLTTLRYADEIRGSGAYFEDIADGNVAKDQTQLAEQLIESKTDNFDPEQYTDRYQDELLKIIKAKIEGSEPVVIQEDEVGKVVNFMEALKQNVHDSSKPAKKPPKKPAAKSVAAASKKKKKAKGA